MPLIKLQFQPGVNRDQTSYTGEGGWYACDKVRFRSGYPQKIGGWIKYTPTPFKGVCRQMWNWVTTFGDNLLALGTNRKVYIETGGAYYNITPFDAPLAGSNTFAVTNGSAVVSVTTATPLPDWLSTGDTVRVAGFASALGGVPASQLNGVRIVTVTGSSTFTFTVSATASSTTSVSGSAYTVQTEIAPGNPISLLGAGWGTGTWGRDAWGLGAGTGGINLPQRDWWFDNFDNDLVLNIRNGAPYWWERGLGTDPTGALNTRAITLQAYADANSHDPDAVPVKVMQLMVSQQDKHLLAFGAVPFGSTNPDDFDALLIRWADQDTPTDWTPSQFNSAGDLRVSRGSRIVRAVSTRQEILVWTDGSLHALQFTGTTDVFALQEYATNISIASPRAVVVASDVVYWMGVDKFYAYTGRVETLPCTLLEHVFGDINFDQLEQVVCGTNEEWNEVWWFYPTADSSVNNAYVVYNYQERIWYYGTLARTAWLDSPMRLYPHAANTSVTVNGLQVSEGDGYLYSHEFGSDADGAAMNSFIESSDFDLDSGDQFMLTRRLIPDVNLLGSVSATPQVTITMRPRSFPGSGFAFDPADTQRVVQSTVGKYTEQVFIRARARQMAFRLSSDQVGVHWQLGSPRLDVRPDGRR
ncbi:MAG: hypothetical protein ACK4WM_10025 [Thermoflexales bacterium]